MAILLQMINVGLPNLPPQKNVTRPGIVVICFSFFFSIILTGFLKVDHKMCLSHYGSMYPSLKFLRVIERVIQKKSKGQKSGMRFERVIERWIQKKARDKNEG